MACPTEQGHHPCQPTATGSMPGRAPLKDTRHGGSDFEGWQRPFDIFRETCMPDYRKATGRKQSRRDNTMLPVSWRCVTPQHGAEHKQHTFCQNTPHAPSQASTTATANKLTDSACSLSPTSLPLAAIAATCGTPHNHREATTIKKTCKLSSCAQGRQCFSLPPAEAGRSQ